MKQSRSFVALGLISAGVLYYAWLLSQTSRTWLDWVVIGLAGAAALWSFVGLSIRMYASGGRRSLWHVQRTLLFWIVGFLNTALIRPEHIGTWRNTVGWIMIILAAVDTACLAIKERDARQPPAQQERH